MVTLRPYQTSDEAMILEKIALYFHPRDTRETLLSWLEPQYALYLVQKDGTTAGFLRLGYPYGSNIAWLEDISVDAHLREQGIATQAIRAAEEIVRELPGYTVLCMNVQPENENALRLYHHLGYDTLHLLCLRKNFDGGKPETQTEILGLPMFY